MIRLLICLIAAGTLAGTATASSTARWTTASATAKLKATWTTVDPKAHAAVEEHIDQELAGGRLPTDPIVVALQADLRRTLHAAHVTAARCAGVGKAVNRRYSRFHCTATATGTERTPPDRQFYTASVKLTVTTAHGFVVKTGWR